VHQSGEAGARVMTHSGMKVDLRVVAPDQFGNVLQHFTGAKAHNVQLREGRGELEAAAKGELPELIEAGQLRGDLHCHTTLSDGRNTLEEMVAAAQALGYEYLAVTDHSASHGFGNHVTPEALEARIEEIAALNERLDGFRVLAGTESNILTDGKPDYPDELLERLDWVIASIHTSFGMDEDAMTERMIAAIEHPWVDAIGHPTGRKIETRPAYSIDMTRVIAAAAKNGTMIEINSAPDRRDMNESHARAAAAAGVLILIDSDAHGAETLTNVRFGIATARRAWLTAENVVNTRSWKDFAPLRKRARS
jgi:DNA polymerase (family 10)